MKRRHVMMEGRSMKRVVLLVAVVLLVMAGAAAAYYLTTGQVSDRTNKVGEEPYPEPVLSSSQQEAEEILGQEYDDPSEAGKKLTAAEAEADTVTDKEAYALAQVSVYADAGQNDTALAKALDADKKYRTANTAATVAGLYYAQGNYAQAAAYYQTAADRSEKTADPTQRSPYNDYMNSKREAEAKL